MKKKWIGRFLFLNIAVLTNSLYALDNDDDDQGYNVTENQIRGAYNAPARIDVQGSKDFFLSGSFLYWEIKEKGLNVSMITETNNQSYPQKMDFHYSPGFRLGAGYNSNYDDWSYSLDYLRIVNNSSSKKTQENNETITPIWSFPNGEGVTPAVLSSEAKWNVDFNLFDASCSRAYYLGKKLILNSFFGLRGGWIDQKIKAEYLESGSVHVLNEIKTDSWLLGPRAGAVLNFLFGWGIKLQGNIATSLFYQDFKTKLYQHRDNTNPIHAKNDVGYITPAVETALGLSFGNYFLDKKWHLKIAALYEFNLFFDQNNLRSLDDYLSNYKDGALENLMLHGLTISAKLDF